MSTQESEITTVLGKGSVFEGKLLFEGAVRIDGEFSGEIRARGSLVVGETAHVAASVEADHVVVQGRVEGDLKATGLVQVLAPARVQGTLEAPQVEIQRGAVFNGTCVMAEQPVAARTAEQAPPEETAAEA